MTKYYIFDGPINQETTQRLINFINAVEEPMQIGLVSNGGDKSATLFLIDVLNQNKDRITLVAMAGIYSSAFRLFKSFEGKKKMAFGVVGMWHYSGQEIRMNCLGKPDYYDGIASFESLKQWDKAHDLEFAKSFMNNMELKKFNRAQEVFFDFGRMKEIFPDVEII